jgi:hypothetical protein
MFSAGSAVRLGPAGAGIYGRPVAQIVFDEWIAECYETLWPELFDPAVLDPAVDVLAELAGAGPALEFGIGTGRVALPLRPLVAWFGSTTG